MELREKLLIFLIISLFAVFPVFANPLFSPVFTVPKVWFFWISGSFMFLVLNFYTVDKDVFRRLAPFMLYLAIALLSVLLSDSRSTAFFGEYARWDGVVTIFLSGVLFAAPIIGLNADKVNACLKALLVSSIPVSLLAFYERFFQNPFILLTKTYDPAGHGALNSMDMSRSVASFGSPLYLAAFLVLVIPISIYFLSKEQPRDRLLGKIALFMSTLALLLTYSRGAWIGIVIALVWLGLVGRGQLGSIKKSIVVLLVVSVAFGTAFSLLKPGEISLGHRILSIFKAEAGARPGIWDSTLAMIESRPLLGYGPDSFKINFVKFKQKNWNTNSRQPVPDKAHNEVFQQAATTGVIGLTAFLWLMIYILLKINNSAGNGVISACIGASLIAYMTQSLFNFFQISTSPIFWLLAGLGIAVSSANKKRLPSRETGALWYYKLGLRTLVCMPIVIFANFLWIADHNFQQSLAAGSDSGKKIAYLNNAVYLFRYEERYVLNLGKTLARQYKEQRTPYLLAASDKAFKQALALNPKSVEALLSRADLFLAASLANLEPQKAGDKGAGLYVKNALEAYDSALRIDPLSTDGYLGRGIAEAYANNFEEAISNWEKAVTIDPGLANAYFNIGWAYERLNKEQKALKAYQKAVKLDPDMADARAAKLRLTK